MINYCPILSFTFSFYVEPPCLATCYREICIFVILLHHTNLPSFFLHLQMRFLSFNVLIAGFFYPFANAFLYFFPFLFSYRPLSTERGICTNFIWPVCATWANKHSPHYWPIENHLWIRFIHLYLISQIIERKKATYKSLCHIKLS